MVLLSGRSTPQKELERVKTVCLEAETQLFESRDGGQHKSHAATSDSAVGDFSSLLMLRRHYLIKVQKRTKMIYLFP